MHVAVGLMDGLGLDGDRCIRVIPGQLVTGKSCLHSWNKGVHAKTQLSGSVSILTWNKKSLLNSMKVGFRGLGQKPNFQNSISLLFTKSVEL